MNRSPGLNVVLYQPEIPQNTGNIGRTCVATNSRLWIVRPIGFRIDEHHVRRSGLDYWQHLDLRDMPDWQAMQEELPMERTFYFTKSATRRYTDVAYQPGDFFVFGRETQGLPPEILRENTERCVSFPMSPRVRSLNLANSVAIAVYEAIRQWGEIPPVE